jgi:hypothetical protein
MRTEGSRCPQAEPIKTRVPTRVQWALWAPHRAELLGAHSARGQPHGQCRATRRILGRRLGSCPRAQSGQSSLRPSDFAAGLGPARRAWEAEAS